MATSTYPAMGGAKDTTSQATLIPEIWSNEVRSEFESKIVLADLVKNIDHTGQKGDIIHLPAIAQGTASAKAENTAVTIQNNTETEVQVALNQHFEYSFLIEDRTDIQSIEASKSVYIRDSGYQLAKQIDTSLHELAKSIGDGDGSDYTHSASSYCDASTGLTAYATDTVVSGDVFTDACFRDIIQRLDDADVPFDERAFVIPPSLKNAIMGIDRYVSSDFVSGQGVQNGLMGELYGIPIYVSSNCPTIETASDNSAGGALKGATLFHREAYVLAMQNNIRTQTSYKQEFLGELVTSDVLYGVKVYRTNAAQLLVVNA